MLTRIEIEDLEHQPKIIIDNNGQVTAIEFDSPFAEVDRDSEGHTLTIYISEKQKCSGCKKKKDKQSFYISRKGLSGYQRMCIECTKKKDRGRRVNKDDEDE